VWAIVITGASCYYWAGAGLGWHWLRDGLISGPLGVLMDGRPEVPVRLCPALPLRIVVLGSRAAGVATAACTTVVIAGHGAGLTHRSGVVTRGFNALLWRARQRLGQGWYLSLELCSSVKHSPKHMQRPRQHADAGFRGGALSGELILGGWPPSREGQGTPSLEPSLVPGRWCLLLWFLFRDQVVVDDV